jgi:hypothetical protein
VTPTLIYCAGGNRRFAEIAIRRGFRYGAQLPSTVYFAPYFADQNWKKPVRSKYMGTLEKHRPDLATVLDWEHEYQLQEVMEWAEETSQYVETVIIIPKVVGGIKRLPKSINGKEVRLGYSAASTFSSTPVSLSEFKGWPVHCLGGSPRTQMQVFKTVECRSADGNYIQQQARERGQFLSPAMRGKRNGWPRLQEAGLGHVGKDAIYLAFELTCIAVPMVWAGESGVSIYEAQMAWATEAGFQPIAKQLSLFRSLS